MTPPPPVRPKNFPLSLALPCSRQIHLCERAKREKVSLIDPGVAAEEVGERERERPVLSAEEGYSKAGQWNRPCRETTSRSLCIACNPYEAGKTVVKVAKEGGSGKSGICPFNEVLARSRATRRRRRRSVQRVLAVPCKVLDGLTATVMYP